MPESNLTATLHTSMGDINVILFPDQAPKTVKNFVGLAEGTLGRGVEDPVAATGVRLDLVVGAEVDNGVGAVGADKSDKCVGANVEGADEVGTSVNNSRRGGDGRIGGRRGRYGNLLGVGICAY